MKLEMSTHEAAANETSAAETTSTAPSQEPTGGIKSVEKAALLLRVFAQMRGAARLVDVAAAAGMSPSMTRAYLISLIRSDLIRQNLDTGRYDLGPAAAEIGFAALARMDFLQLGKAALLELSEKFGETVMLTAWNIRGPVVIAKVDGPRTSVYEVRIGSHVSLVPTSTGHIFIAYLPRSMWGPLLGERYGFGAHPVKPLSETQIVRIRRQVRKTGVSIVDASPTLPGFGGISAPVFDHDDKLLAAITIIVPSEDVKRAAHRKTAAELVRVAARLSRQLGASQANAMGS